MSTASTSATSHSTGLVTSMRGFEVSMPLELVMPSPRVTLRLPLPARGERVGVRGALHTVALAENPPHPPRKSAATSPRKRGEVKRAHTCRHHPSHPKQ